MVVLAIDLQQIHQVWDRLGHSGVRQQLNLHQILRNGFCAMLTIVVKKHILNKKSNFEQTDRTAYGGFGN